MKTKNRLNCYLVFTIGMLKKKEQILEHFLLVCLLIHSNL